MYEGQQEDSGSQPLRLEGARQGLTPKRIRNPVGLRQQKSNTGANWSLTVGLGGCRPRPAWCCEGAMGVNGLTDGMERAQQARHVAPGPARGEVMRTDVDT